MPLSFSFKSLSRQPSPTPCPTGPSNRSSTGTRCCFPTRLRRTLKMMAPPSPSKARGAVTGGFIWASYWYGGWQGWGWGGIWRFGIRQLSLPDREYLFLFTVKVSFLEFQKNKKQKILKANKVSSLVCKSLRGCYIKFKTLQPHLHLTRNGKLNVTTLFILKSDGLFAASQS